MQILPTQPFKPDGLKLYPSKIFFYNSSSSSSRSKSAPNFFLGLSESFPFSWAFGFCSKGDFFGGGLVEIKAWREKRNEARGLYFSFHGTEVSVPSSTFSSHHSILLCKGTCSVHRAAGTVRLCAPCPAFAPPTHPTHSFSATPSSLATVPMPPCLAPSLD